MPLTERILIGAFIFGIIGLFTLIGILTPAQADFVLGCKQFFVVSRIGICCGKLPWRAGIRNLNSEKKRDWSRFAGR